MEHKSKILVVDDEASVLLTTEAILKQEGYDVDAVETGAAALGAIRTRHYDLVLTDLKMPHVDGLAVLAEVRKRSPNTVTVMMTGYGSLDSALEAVQLGAYEYLLKPIEVADLKLAVRRSLERKRFSEIDTLYRISRTVANSQDADAVLSQVCEAAQTVLSLEQVCLVRLDRQIKTEACPQNLRAVFELTGVVQRLQSGEVISSDNDSAVASWARSAGLGALALVPGLANQRLVCVLCASNGAKGYEFHASARRFLQALADKTAMTLENASLISELRENNRELAAANQKLKELDKLKSQFLSVATHELRTPLSIILGYNSMIAESLGERLSKEERKIFRESVAACKRLIRLVNSMLDIAQIESGKMKMNFAPVDVRPLISGVIALFQHEARAKNINLKMELPSRLPRLAVDAERIEQVLVNLLGNAVKFTEAGGNITLALRQRSDLNAVEITVSDTGIGISAEQQATIFDEFAQIARQNSRRHREGSGLGLAIAKRIVEAHEGTLSVTSKPGKGSSFCFTIPTKSPAHAISAVSA